MFTNSTRYKWSLLLIFFLPAPDVALAINKCIDKAGNISYQEGRCPDNAKHDTVKVPAVKPSVVKPDARALDGNDDKKILDLVSTQSTLEGCALAAPDFANKFRPEISAWKSANATDLARYERTPRYQEMLDRGRTQSQQMLQPGVREKLARFCEAQFIPALKNTLPK